MEIRGNTFSLRPENKMSLYHLKTELGTVTITAGEGTLERLEFDHPEAVKNPINESAKEVFEQIADSNHVIRLKTTGTPFQKEVWQALLNIPLKETTSYGKIAEGVGRPKASRAVGTAIGSNPISLIIPCHRVITSNGKLGGYRWNVDRKQRILDWEKENIHPLEALFGLEPDEFKFEL